MRYLTTLGLRVLILVMNTFNFIKFNGVYPRGDTKIGFQKSGLIRLSSGFCRITDVKKFKYTVMYFDSSKRAIALKFTDSKEDGRLKVTNDGTGATISATSFLKANNLMVKSTWRRYDWKKINLPEIGEVFVIELNKNEKDF